MAHYKHRYIDYKGILIINTDTGIDTNSEQNKSQITKSI